MLGAEMESDGPQTAYEIENKELLPSDYPLHHGTEDYQGVHIEENMPETAVHKHMGDYLPPVEIW